jgi:hypothetical protein
MNFFVELDITESDNKYQKALGEKRQFWMNVDCSYIHLCERTLPFVCIAERSPVEILQEYI